MDILQLIAVIFGTTGFWRVLDLLIKYRSEKNLKTAETSHLQTTAQNNIIENWVQWSQKLEQRVKESEQLSAEMELIVEQQKKQISCLQHKVALMEQKNSALQKELNQLKTGTNSNN